LIVDGQRHYPAEPEPWYPEREDGPRGPGQQRYTGDPARPTEPQRYGEGFEQPYPDRGFLEPRDPDQRDIEPRDFDHREYPAGPGYPDPASPDPRYEGQRFDPAPPTRRRPSRPTRGKRSGLDLPDTPAPGLDAAVGFGDGHDDAAAGVPRFHAEVLDRSALRRPDSRPDGEPVAAEPRHSEPAYPPGHGPTQAIPSPTVTYRARRPGIAALMALAAVFAEVMVLFKVLFESAFAHPTNVGGVLAGLCALAAVPMITVGVYGLATGAATAYGPQIGRAWLRLPLAYLPAGLVLMLAAGLAA
jgi:hypothetical protein